MTTYTKNVNLDATLVHAAMRGLFEPCAIGLGMTPEEAFGRAEWLKKQTEAYIKRVSDRVVEMENEAKQNHREHGQGLIETIVLMALLVLVVYACLVIWGGISAGVGH